MLSYDENTINQYIQNNHYNFEKFIDMYSTDILKTIAYVLDKPEEREYIETICEEIIGLPRQNEKVPSEIKEKELTNTALTQQVAETECTQEPIKTIEQKAKSQKKNKCKRKKENDVLNSLLNCKRELAKDNDYFEALNTIDNLKKKKKK